MAERTLKVVEVTDDQPKYTYRVKPGHTFGLAQEFKAGAEVQLTLEEARGFLDKLEPVSSEAKADAEETPAAVTEAAPQVAKKGKTPAKKK